MYGPFLDCDTRRQWRRAVRRWLLTDDDQAEREASKIVQKGSFETYYLSA